MSLYERTDRDYVDAQVEETTPDGMYPSEEPDEEPNDYSEPEQSRSLFDEIYTEWSLPKVRDEQVALSMVSSDQSGLQPFEIVEEDHTDEAREDEQQKVRAIAEDIRDGKISTETKQALLDAFAAGNDPNERRQKLDELITKVNQAVRELDRASGNISAYSQYLLVPRSQGDTMQIQLWNKRSPTPVDAFSIRPKK